MNVVVLSGWVGTRLAKIEAKPMIEMCGRPIFWHIMRQYPRPITWE